MLHSTRIVWVRGIVVWYLNIDGAAKVAAILIVVIALFNIAKDRKRELHILIAYVLRTTGWYISEVVAVCMIDGYCIRIVLIRRLRLNVANKLSHIVRNTFAVVDTCNVEVP